MGITCRAYQPSDLEEVKDIADRQLGKGYLSDNMIREYHEDKTKHFDIALNDKEEVIAIHMVTTVYFKHLERELLKGFQDVIYYFPEHSYINVNKVFAIRSDYTREEIGPILMKFTIDQLEPVSKYWLGVAWSPGKNAGSDQLLKTVGLTPAVKIKNYWYENSLKTQFICAACGTPPCTCSAVLYVKNE